MSATAPRKPQRPARPGQLIVSALVPPETRELLREVARVKHCSVSDLLREALEDHTPHLQNEVAVNGDNERAEGARDGP